MGEEVNGRQLTRRLVHWLLLPSIEERRVEISSSWAVASGFSERMARKDNGRVIRRVSKWSEDERHEAESESRRRKDIIYFTVVLGM